MASGPHPFCKSLRIHENEIAREHAKLSANQRVPINLEKKRHAKIMKRSKQQGGLWTLTEVNYY